MKDAGNPKDSRLYMMIKNIKIESQLFLDFSLINLSESCNRIYLKLNHNQNNYCFQIKKTLFKTNINFVKNNKINFK